MPTSYDILCVGAGPTGLACAIEAKRAGMRPIVIDKGCLCNSIYHYPVNMQFFTTAERLEIGDLPLTSSAGKPTRTEALKYYRRTAEHYDLELRLYERVEDVSGGCGDFTVSTRDGGGARCAYHTARIIVATGYYDRPNLLGVEGEDLPHVSHYYTEPHSYWHKDVLVVGAKNSAAEAALDLFRAGARVTMVHRGAGLGATLKYWVRPDIENRIKAGEIQAHFSTRVVRIGRDAVWIRNGSGERPIWANHMFVLTGYHPDFEFLEHLGIVLDPETRKPQCDPTTLETNVPGIHVAGVIIGGKHTGEIFIENGRFHGKQIIAALTGKSGSLGAPPVSPPGE